jgi:hypothetical protein
VGGLLVGYETESSPRTRFVHSTLPNFFCERAPLRNCDPGEGALTSRDGLPTVGKASRLTLFGCSASGAGNPEGSMARWRRSWAVHIPSSSLRVSPEQAGTACLRLTLFGCTILGAR